MKQWHGRESEKQEGGKRGNKKKKRWCEGVRVEGREREIWLQLKQASKEY